MFTSNFVFPFIHYISNKKCITKNNRLLSMSYDFSIFRKPDCGIIVDGRTTATRSTIVEPILISK